MPAPFGDFHLAGYVVDCGRAEIRLRATDKRRVTEVVFFGVQAYHFEHDNFGTILGHIVELLLEAFLEQHAAQFDEGSRQEAWPLFWQGSVASALAHLKAASVRAYEVTSAYGMGGWVLAHRFDTFALPDAA